MQRSARHTRAKWLASLLLILLLTAMGSQNVMPQNLYEEHPLGDIPLDAATYQRYLKVWPESMLAPDALPASYDARDDGIVTSPKNQGNCGSCWAFAAVGGLESHILKASGPLLDLSEQQQVSCNTAMLGCAGGSASAILYWREEGGKGPLDETCFPYTASDSTRCDEASCSQYGYRVTDYHTVPTTTNDFKNSLYIYGPSYWRFNVYSDFDSYWSNGSPGDVYVSRAGATYRGGHAVLLIGWDDSKGALLCKNSWGGGGPNNDGTFWIAYTGHYYNLSFGMSNFSLTSLTCSSDTVCDDGLYCNGAETCVNSVCHDGTPPVCGDDGFFCNGTEVCDENLDDCGHTGDPCEPGYTCDEEADQCHLASCGNGTCDQGENCTNCSEDCIGGSSGGTGDPEITCFKGVTDGTCHPTKDSPECPDCTVSWCCGDGVCEGEEDSFNCALDCGAPPVCGDGTCDPDENPCNCALDCGDPPASEVGYCGDGIDNDCDGPMDCDDGDCSGDPACGTCLPKAAPCDTDSDCCSNKCRGGACR